MPKVLIGITSCHQYRQRVNSQRMTWIPKIQGADYKVFLGWSKATPPPEAPDEVYLWVPDDYDNLHLKSREIIRYAYSHGYDYLFKVDDDAYVHPDRLLASGFQAHDYIGAWIIGESGFSSTKTIRYQSQRFVPGGCGMWLSRKAMEVLLASDVNKLSSTEKALEDHWVGWTLGRAGINPICDCRYLNLSCFAHPENFENLAEYTGDVVFPTAKDVISICEFTPEEMLEEHEKWKNGTRSLPVWKPEELPREFTVAGVKFNLPKRKP